METDAGQGSHGRIPGLTYVQTTSYFTGSTSDMVVPTASCSRPLRRALELDFETIAARPPSAQSDSSSTFASLEPIVLSSAIACRFLPRGDVLPDSQKVTDAVLTPSNFDS